MESKKSPFKYHCKWFVLLLVVFSHFVAVDHEARLQVLASFLLIMIKLIHNISKRISQLYWGCQALPDHDIQHLKVKSNIVTALFGCSVFEMSSTPDIRSFSTFILPEFMINHLYH